MLRVLQVCNVGSVVGGTAACAWSAARSLPGMEHHVAFLSGIAAETRKAFSECHLHCWEGVTQAGVAAIGADVVILHNTSRGRVEGRLPAATIQYLHSRIGAAEADVTLYCSRWLAARYGADAAHVCVQGVPRAPRCEMARETRALREQPVIGRLCTPQKKKWPASAVELYRGLAARFRGVRWEFVGCPSELREALAAACGGRAEFFEAGWGARSRLWEWDALLYHNPDVTESFGRTCAEAMRVGCIPMVDNRGGFVEQGEGESRKSEFGSRKNAGVCGFLCDDARGFAGAVEGILDPAVRRRMSRAARVRGDDRYSLRRFGRELVGRMRGLDAR